MSRSMSAPLSSHSMAQEGAASLPAKRKRGRPRKDEALVPELSQRSQRRRINPPDTSSRDLAGQAFSGVLDGPFEAGYVLTAHVGGQFFKGLLFDPRLSPPITAENDIAPDLPMISVGPLQPPPRHEPVVDPRPAQLVHQSVTTSHAPFAVGAVQSTVPVPDPVMHQNVIAVRSPLRNEPTALPLLALPVQRNVEAIHRVRTPMQLMEQNIEPVQPLPKNESAAMTEKDVRVDILVSDNQGGEGVMKLPKETETGSGKQVSEHQVLVVGIQAEPLDVCMSQVGTSAPGPKSMADPEMSTSRPELSKAMPIDVSMEAGPGMEFLRL